MLTITLPAVEFAEEFTVHLEHSLVSLSKWEAMTERAFYGHDEKTVEDTVSYIECMILDENPPEKFRYRLNDDIVRQIDEYLNSKQTAAWFNDPAGPQRSSEVMTADLIYYWMVQFKIPFSCETWHLNRLLTLIRICSIKQSPPKKMSPTERNAEIRRLNAERQAKLGTRG